MSSIIIQRAGEGNWHIKSSIMKNFWRQGEDSGRRTRVGGGWIPVVDSGYKRRMDDRPQRGLGVEEVDNIATFENVKDSNGNSFCPLLVNLQKERIKMSTQSNFQLSYEEIQLKK